MNKKTVVLVVRDGTEWTSEDLLTLFAEEGYETRDVDVTLEGWWTALDELKPFGAIGNSLTYTIHSAQYYPKV
jgi:hypothetical protein